MLRTLRVLALLIAAAIALPAPFHGAPQAAPQSGLEHTKWAGEALRRMLTIKPGMSRGELLTVFTTEGGISTRTHRVYVSRECPYFKVTVEFRATASNRSAQEDNRDVILEISRPFLQFSVAD
jgi:hypothetical protein